MTSHHFSHDSEKSSMNLPAPASEALIWKWFESLFSFTRQWKRKQTHINIFNITWLKAHGSHQFIKCRQMCMGILMIHCCKLMGTDESEKIGIYFQGLGGRRYCNTRKMFLLLVHDIISKCPPREWCLFFYHVIIFLKDISEKKRIYFLFLFKKTNWSRGWFER